MSKESEKELERYRRRFSPLRYKFTGTNSWGCFDMIPLIKGLTDFPDGEEYLHGEEESSSESSDE